MRRTVRKGSSRDFLADGDMVAARLVHEVGEILAAEGLEGPEVMGRPSPQPAYVGLHDGTGRGSTVLFLDSPTNVRFPGQWFVRNDPYACVSCSFMFDEEYALEPGAELALDYRVVLGDGAWPCERIEDYVSGINTHPGKES